MPVVRGSNCGIIFLPHFFLCLCFLFSWLASCKGCRVCGDALSSALKICFHLLLRLSHMTRSSTGRGAVSSSTHTHSHSTHEHTGLPSKHTLHVPLCPSHSAHLSSESLHAVNICPELDMSPIPGFMRDEFLAVWSYKWPFHWHAQCSMRSLFPSIPFFFHFSFFWILFSVKHL